MFVDNNNLLNHVVTSASISMNFGIDKDRRLKNDIDFYPPKYNASEAAGSH